jgi:dinuclear metal center YbgI/SA1388 family protein
MKLKEICGFLDAAVPLSFQEEYDNSGLQVGNPEAEIMAALLTLDVTEEVLGEAIASGCNLIISHHPLIFRPLKQIAHRSHTERIVESAIKNSISIYSAHTNLDNSENGVSIKMAATIGLSEIKPLVPLKGRLLKLVTYVPSDHAEKVREAIFAAGAGVIGNYDKCSFNSEGLGSFRGNEKTSPFAGEKGMFHFEQETRIETILPAYLQKGVLKALTEAHPYEEPAYDIYLLANDYPVAGMGVTGMLKEEMSEMAFLGKLSTIFDSKGIRYSPPSGRNIRKVALCGGSGAGLLNNAIAAGADAFITGDVKYHSFHDAAGRILLADIGHYESEKYSTEILYDLIIKKFPTFALRFSGINTNPINYL